MELHYNLKQFYHVLVKNNTISRTCNQNFISTKHKLRIKRTINDAKNESIGGLALAITSIDGKMSEYILGEIIVIIKSVTAAEIDWLNEKQTWAEDRHSRTVHCEGQQKSHELMLNAVWDVSGFDLALAGGRWSQSWADV